MFCGQIISSISDNIFAMSLQVANMLFLDAPVGTGFSYSKTEADYYIKDDIAVAQTNYQFLQKVNSIRYDKNKYS